MKNIFKIFFSDLKKLRTNIVAIVVMIGLTVIPSLYAWFNILSNWDPYGSASTSRISVAVVSEDEGAEIDSAQLNIGDSIIEALEANTTIGWVFSESKDEAVEGVESGEYYAALVVPKDFSKDFVSFLTDTLQHPSIEYYCNQKKNAIAPKITDKAKTAVQQQVNTTFINTVVSTVAGTGGKLINSEGVKELTQNQGDSFLEVMTNQLVSARETLTTYDVMLDALISMIDLSSSVSDTAGSAAPQVSQQIAQQQAQLSVLQAIVDGNGLASLSELSNALSDNISEMKGIMSNLSSIYSNMTGSASDFNESISYTSASLSDTKNILTGLEEKLDTAIENLNELQSGEAYGLVAKMLDADSDTLGSFLSSPVTIQTEKIYAIENYGSAASPFYIILSIWVGGLIMVAIMHTPVHKRPDIPEDAKYYQKFFGRYLIFYCIGQLQALLMALGVILYIGIQCYHPFLLWLACSVTSFVFTFFMFALAAAFGNIGEALAIVFMVVQVAGSGGTFPIEVLPKAYQLIYKYLPFPYAMNALRETIGGMYRLDYWKYLGILLIYAVIAVFIGLVLRIPFVKMNHMIEKSKEKSGVMI
jgi:putative membrane protein